MIAVFVSCITALFLLLPSTPDGLAASDCPGWWGSDAEGLPNYSMPCAGDRSEKHIFGNSQANLVGNRTGAVYITATNRGAAAFGRRVGGGFSIIEYEAGTSREVFVTGGEHATPEASFLQTFGVNYLTSKASDNVLEITHHVLAPWSTAAGTPTVTDTVSVRNMTDEEVTFIHYEIWDASYLALSSPSTWVRPVSPAFRFITGLQDWWRSLFSALFRICIESDGDTITAQRTWWLGQLIAPDEITTNNQYVQDLTLTTTTPDVRCFEMGTEHSRPRYVLGTSWNQPVLIAESRHTLSPAEDVELNFEVRLTPNPNTIGTTPLAETPALAAAVSPDMHDCIAVLGTDRCEQLSREFRWKATQFQGWALQRDFHGKFAPPQGSLYFYRQGWDGAPRDVHQMVPMLSYVNPDLARQTLEFTMQLQLSNENNPKHGPGNLSYGFYGYGCAGEAITRCQHILGPGEFGVRSDLDQYLMWALLAYAHAIPADEFEEWFTERDVPFYPPGTLPETVTGDSPLDHVRAAFYHLRDHVGIGEHGLVRLREGDWNDSAITLGVYGEHLLPIPVQQEVAESVPATQMVLSILPDLAELVTPYDPGLAAEMEEFVASVVDPLRSVYNPGSDTPWFPRAYMQDHKGEWVLVGQEYLNLHAQGWALQNNNFVEYGVMNREDQLALLELIHDKLDEPSPIGATLVNPNIDVPFSKLATYYGSLELSWSSHRNLLTVAYSRFPETRSYAWESLHRTSYENYSEVFPDNWWGVLSGPDGWNSQRGNAWDFGILAMDEFPYANSNPHAMWSWALLKVAGIAE